MLSAAPKATVIVVHGLGEHSGRYTPLASALNQAGYAVASIDLPGHGMSAGKRGHIDSFTNYHDAIVALTSTVREESPDGPLYLLGHSMGGLIVSHMAPDHQQLFNGLLLSGASIKSPQQPPAWQLSLVGLIAGIAPRLGLIKLDVGGLCRDPDVVERYKKDPLVNTGKLSARFISQMFRATQETIGRAQEIVKPVLIMHGGDDIITEPEGSRQLYNAVSSTDRTLTIYDGFYHEIFNEPEAANVYTDVLQWLNERCQESAR